MSIYSHPNRSPIGNTESSEPSALNSLATLYFGGMAIPCLLPVPMVYSEIPREKQLQLPNGPMEFSVQVKLSAQGLSILRELLVSLPESERTKPT